MNDETISSKVNRLLQKSRQAFRIYSSMSKSAKVEHNEYADMQATEWKNINAELIRQLTQLVERNPVKKFTYHIARMRDSMLADYRRVEAELNTEHRDIIAAAQRADFIKVAQLSRILISKKAFVQAAQAASHELSLIIDDKANYTINDSQISHVNEPSPQQNSIVAENAASITKALTDNQNMEDFDEPAIPRLARVIPLRR